MFYSLRLLVPIRGTQRRTPRFSGGNMGGQVGDGLARHVLDGRGGAALFAAWDIVSPFSGSGSEGS